MKLIGLVSPNLSEDSLQDVYKIFPEEIRIEGRALKVGEYSDKEFHRVEQLFAGHVRDLASYPLDLLMVTGELFLSYKGPGSDLQILELVKGITSIPASTVLTAVVRGCRTVGIKRPVMASPFPDDQNERLIRWLAYYDIEVAGFRGLGCPHADVIWKLPPESGYDLVCQLLREHPDADGIYMPCNKWRTISVIDRIEKEFGKPVVTNTQAWVCDAWRLMGMRDPIPGYGRLLSEFKAN